MSEIDIAWLLTRNWWADVDVCALEPRACWPWRKSLGSHGYGQTWDGTTVRLAHRVAWTLYHMEQIPDGMTIDHICRNRRCCRPKHMRLLTNVENATDNGQGRKTHCPALHPYDEANTYVDPKGHRRCRACARGF